MKEFVHKVVDKLLNPKQKSLNTPSKGRMYVSEDFRRFRAIIKIPGVVSGRIDRGNGHYWDYDDRNSDGNPKLKKNEEQ